MRKSLLLAFLVIGTIARAQSEYAITVESKQPSGVINEMLYGQLFEHIYFSANNGVWQELIQERSFEPEQYPGIHPRDGYFDGWFMDDNMVLHSPTRYEQPLRIDSIETSDFDLTMDVNWRSYKLARRAWSGGLMDIRFAFRNKADGSPYFVRIHDPYYESRTFTPAQTQSQIDAANEAAARAALQQQSATANFSVCQMEEREMAGFGGRPARRMNMLIPLVSALATKEQVNEEQRWHKLHIMSRGSKVTVFWDGQEVLNYDGLEESDRHFVTFWVNYTEATYRNIRLTAADGKVLFEGTPGDVRIPAVAQQWTPFGDGGRYRLCKDDAVNMRYSQEISAGKNEAGIFQGPQNIVSGEKYIGSIYAKGKGELMVGLRNPDGQFVTLQSLGKVGKAWKKYEFTLEPQVSCDGDFAIMVKDGTIQVDMATMTTQTGLSLGGFRPDILQAVKELHPTCLRWPGGGYVAQYDWKWGIGPQENRQRWAHWMWMDYDQNCFGTDEFIRFCREVNSEPIIVVSVKFERPAEEYDSILQDALHWLRYCNAPATDEWGAKRAANGHPEPYNVKYWEIDNEMWEMGIDRYEKCVRDFSTEMRKIDPSIKIIACGGFREDEQFIQRSGQYFDYLSLHHYEQQGGYATGPLRLGQQYDRYAQMIANGPNPNIKLFISEWNLNSIDWRTGLFAGGFLNMCEARDVVAMGAAALFLRRTDAPDWNNAFINFDYKDLFKAPNCQVTELWYDHFSKYRLAFSGETGNLSVSTTLSENGDEVIVKVVNPTDEPATLRIKGDWTGVKDAVFEYFAPDSLTVANSMENKHAVALQKTTPKTEGTDVVLPLPALSAGVLTITIINENMTNAELREKIVMALDDMKAKAIEMGIHGVATASVLNKGEAVDWIGEMRVVGTPLDTKGGFNLVAVAWSKCGEFIATGADSGNPNHQTMTGELGYAGGAYDEYAGCKMAFAFSGATSEEDLVVAKYGIEQMKGYLSDKPQADTVAVYKPLATPLKKDQFIQVTIVVNDIHRAAKAWAALLGVPEPEIWVNHLESNEEYPYTYRGENDKPCDLQMCVFEMGNWVIELHQIDDNPSTFREFINKHGQGVHHIGFEVGNACDEVIKELKEMGFDTGRTIGVYPGSSWTIVDTEDVLGVNLNIKPKR